MLPSPQRIYGANALILCNQLTLEEAIEKPELTIADWAKMDNPAQLHLGMQALDAFAEKNNRYIPRPLDSYTR